MPKIAQPAVVALSCLPAVPHQSFEAEIKSIVAAEVSADPRSEAKMKAIARFLLGGVVERAELADKSVHFLVVNLLYSSIYATLLQVHYRA